MHQNWPLGADSGGVKVKAVGILLTFFQFASIKNFKLDLFGAVGYVTVNT